MNLKLLRKKQLYIFAILKKNNAENIGTNKG